MQSPMLVSSTQSNNLSNGKLEQQYFYPKDINDQLLDGLQFSVTNLHFLQDIEWLRSHQDSNNYCLALTLADDRIYAYSIIELKCAPLGLGKVMRINRGPVFSSIKSFENQLELLTRVASDSGVAWIEISPFIYDPSRENIQEFLRINGWEKRTTMREMYASSIVLDLKPALADIRAKFRRSLKTQINKGLKSDIVVNEDFEAGMEPFIDMHNTMASQRGLAPIDDNCRRYLERLFKLNPKNIVLLTAKADTTMLGGILLLRVGNRYIYEWGVTSEDDVYKRLPISHLLHWEGIQICKTNGAEIYDFGGYWLERGDNDPINRFKTGFSKTIEHYLPEFQLTVSSTRTKTLKILMQLRELLK